jgi:hypothetical protein
VESFSLENGHAEVGLRERRGVEEPRAGGRRGRRYECESGDDQTEGCARGDDKKRSAGASAPTPCG